MFALLFKRKSGTVKLYIVDCVGSGKTTLAMRISEVTGVPCYHLDEFVHEEDPRWCRQQKK